MIPPWCQNQKRGLKRILGRMPVAEDRLAGVKHHRAVSLDQDSKRQLRPLAVASEEPLEKLLVGELPDLTSIEEGLNVTAKRLLSLRHGRNPRDWPLVLLMIMCCALRIAPSPFIIFPTVRWNRPYDAGLIRRKTRLVEPRF